MMIHSRKSLPHWATFLLLSMTTDVVTSLNLKQRSSEVLVHSWSQVRGLDNGDALPASSCQVSRVNRVDCSPNTSTNETNCNAKSCCWSPVEFDSAGIPWCFFPSADGSYDVTSRKDTELGFSATLERRQHSVWPNDVMSLQLDVMYEEETRIHFKIYDPNSKRFQVPIETPKVTEKSMDNDYSVEVTRSPFSIKVMRVSSGTTLFDSSAAPLIFADQFIQITTTVPTGWLYGLGEHRQPFWIDPSKNPRLAFWARDQPPAPGMNLYGDYPFYLGMESSGQAFGVFLLNSNAKDINVGHDTDTLLSYTTIGGILDFYIFTGPSPDDVIKQYTDVVGRTFMPPYWALGFHLCRWGYGTSDELWKVIQRMREAEMPYDTQWTDIDYMRSHLDWTYDSNSFATLPEIVEDLHAHGQHYVIIVDPGISNTQSPGTYPPYDEGMQRSVFIRKADDSGPIVGKVWPGNTVYPDFTNPITVDYWLEMASDFHDVLPFDGLWTDMNEPSNFEFGSVDGCPGNSSLDYPPYTPGIVSGNLSDRTLCPSAKQYLSQHYNLHSMYGHFEGIATSRALTSIRQKRTLVISRSTFPGSGKFMGHWTGDNNADWDNLYYSIPAILNFNMFGISLVGADICGFGGDTTEELCTRWMQLGAFYPFMRNHNSIGQKDQDPANPSFSQTAQSNMRDVLLLRYTLLPYLYTLFYHSNNDGSVVARPLFFEYSEDNATYGIDTQFLWGHHLLISPVIRQGQTKVEAYFPRDVWYDYYNGSRVTTLGGSVTLDAPLNKINLHVSGGAVIPTQDAAVTTTISRKKPFGLLVALSEEGTAAGDLFWDGGDSLETVDRGLYNLITFTVSGGKLTSSLVQAGSTHESMTLGPLRVFGVTKPVTNVTVHGQLMAFAYDAVDQVLRVPFIGASLLQNFTVTWS